MNKSQALTQKQTEIVRTLVEWIQCDSVYDEATITKEKPFGNGVSNALSYIATLAKNDGFQVDRCDGYCTEITYGEGEEIIMVLGHADVVPVGTGWDVEPFAGTIQDEKIYGRGASDDKGPTLAAYYALKRIKQSAIPLKRKIRMVVGGNEERGSSCLHYYFNTLKRPHPTYGFTPDASFPLIFGEKGIMGYQYSGETQDDVLLFLQGGIVANSVPEKATAHIKKGYNLSKEFAFFLKENLVEGQYKEHEEYSELSIFGKAAHGSTPEEGVNALVYLLSFLALHTTSQICRHFAPVFASYYGEGMGIDCENELMGKLTLNVGIGEYKNNRYQFVLNIRYPNEVDVEVLLNKLSKQALDRSKMFHDSKPLFVDPESLFVKALWQAYQKVSKDYINQPFTIGGGTYARQTINTVAFGMDFPNAPRGSGNIHGPNECLHIQDLLEGIEIYYEALLSLDNL